MGQVEHFFRSFFSWIPHAPFCLAYLSRRARALYVVLLNPHIQSPLLLAAFLGVLAAPFPRTPRLARRWAHPNNVAPEMKFPLVLLCFANAAIANAAAMKEDSIGCKDIANVKKTMEIAKASSKSSRDFTQAKIAEGVCRWFRKSDVVEIDMQEGRFACVRPPGEVECVWTSEASVNKHPGYTPADVDVGLQRSPIRPLYSPAHGPIRW